jgi:acetylornithine deacetylase
MTVQETLAQLVAIDSVSSRSNVEIADYLQQACESLDLNVRRFPYTDEKGTAKVNLIAHTAPDTDAVPHVELALVGHMDTVPYDGKWEEALILTHANGNLYGRGACDTKAFISAALTAAGSLDFENIKRPLALVFTADEEIGLIGAKRLADEGALQAHYAIVGEPTSLRPMRAGKGYCLAEVLVKGREAHSAYPELGSSAVFAAASFLNRIETIAKQLRAEQHEAFEPPYTTLNVGLITGGTAKNVIPGECRFTLEWRPIPGQKSERVVGMLMSAITDLKDANPEFNCVVDAARADEGFETSPDSRLVGLLEKLTAQKSGTVAFGTEAAQMTQLGAESVVFGPGDIRVAHRTGEYVPVKELESCVNILKHAIEELCF